MLNVGLKIQNWATKLVQERTKAGAKAHSDALISAGYRLRQLTQIGMRQQAPGEVAWPTASPWVQYGSSLLARARMTQRRAERRKRGPRTPAQPLQGTKSRTPLKRLASAVRYQKQIAGDQTIVRIGFLSPAIAKIAAYHAEAHTVPVTAKMRRLIFAVGLGISKASIHIPARPHVSAVYRRNHARIAGFAQQRINAAWAGRDPKSIQAPF
jgi:hypothetical protein